MIAIECFLEASFRAAKNYSLQENKDFFLRKIDIILISYQTGADVWIRGSGCSFFVHVKHGEFIL